MTDPTADRRHGDRPFILRRVFAAPRSALWRAWTDRTEMMRWFGPRGFTMPVCNLDLRAGGSLHYALRGPDGHEMWGRWTIQEAVAPERLVVVQGFSDPAGGLSRHPLCATWPLECLAVTTFTEQEGGTLMELHSSVWNGTPEEHQAFDGAHAGMAQGWAGTMDQLTAHLAIMTGRAPTSTPTDAGKA